MCGVSKPRLLVHDTKCVLHLYEAIIQRSRINDVKNVHNNVFYKKYIRLRYQQVTVTLFTNTHLSMRIWTDAPSEQKAHTICIFDSVCNLQQQVDSLTVLYARLSDSILY